MVKTVRNYRLLKALGHGSFAVVYRAIDTNNNDTVAIKEISRSKVADERSKKHLDAEIRLLKEFDHPNIVRLIDHMASTNNIYLVFEYCGGGDLRVYLDKFGRLSEHTTRFFLLQLCDGLIYLNDRHMIHRDLKPQNILLTEQSPHALLKIADFGFVKFVDEASVAATMCGTPLYMAPEIVDHFEYDAKVDMWSLGCILFEMLVGKTVFLGSTQAEVLSNVKSQDVVFPPHISVSDQIIGLLQKLLKRTPSSRASISELAATCMPWRKDYDLPAALALGDSLAGTEGLPAGRPPHLVPPSQSGAPVAGTEGLPAGRVHLVPPSQSGAPPVVDTGGEVPAAETAPPAHKSPQEFRSDERTGDMNAVGYESIHALGQLPTLVEDGGDDAEDDAAKTIKAPYYQSQAPGTQQPSSRNRERTVSLDTAKAMLTYTQTASSATDTAAGRGAVFGINNPRRQQLSADSGTTNHLGPLGGLGGAGGTGGNVGTDSKDDDSSWEIINHPPPLSGIGAQPGSGNNQGGPHHFRRRSGGGSEYSSPISGGIARGSQPPNAGNRAAIPSGSPGNDASEGLQGSHRQTPSSYFKPGTSSGNPHDSTREDIALLEWCKRLSTIVVCVTEVADNMLKKAVTAARRQFLLSLTPAAIHELRLEMLAQHLGDNEARISCPTRGVPASSRGSSIARVKMQLNEFTTLVNVGFIFFHIIEYLRPCVAKTASLKGGTAPKHTKQSPTSMSASPGNGGMHHVPAQSTHIATVDRVYKHLTGLLEGLQQRAVSCVICSQNIVALLEQDEARGQATPGGPLSPGRLGAGLDSLIEGVQLTKAPSAEVLIYGAAQQFATDGSLFRALGSYKQALSSFESAQILLDYILLWTKDNFDRSNIEKFFKLIGDEIIICRQHDAV